MTRKAKDNFWNTLLKNDVSEAEKILAQFPEFAKIDLRPKESQDLFTHGFALVEAAKQGNYDMSALLLKKGADPNAEIPSDDPPEFGIPICLAVEKDDYAMANLLLDYGASGYAFPYCSQPLIEVLFNKARAAGVESSSIRKGFYNYLENTDSPEISETTSEIIKLYLRVLDLGVEPSLSSVVRDDNLELIEELLRKCPEQESPKLSYPRGSVFENIVYSASWFGYPKMMKMCMDICPELFTVEVSRWSIDRAITSHNRDGRIDDYMELLKTQLDFIQQKGRMEELITETPLRPFYVLAEHFCWHNNYGYKAPLSTGEDIIRVANLFLEYGFDDYHTKHPKEKLTPLEKAKTRLHHQGISDYVAFLENLP